jgi:prophage DNA circulation protein
MAYRNEHDALQAHCESLRRKLKQAEIGSAELQETNAELKRTLAALEGLRITDAEQLVASKDLTRRATLVGSAITLAY